MVSHGEKSYADVLAILRRNVKPESHGCEIAAIRKTRGGQALIELRHGAKDPAKLCEVMLASMGKEGTAKRLTPTATVVIRDITGDVTSDEIVAAVRGGEGVKVNYLGTGSRGTQLAIVSLPATRARQLANEGRLKIGWVYCRVHIRAEAPRCFKCFGAGHRAADCRSADFSKNCRRCGKEGHVHSSAALHHVHNERERLHGPSSGHQRLSGLPPPHEPEQEWLG